MLCRNTCRLCFVNQGTGLVVTCWTQPSIACLNVATVSVMLSRPSEQLEQHALPSFNLCYWDTSVYAYASYPNSTAVIA